MQIRLPKRPSKPWPELSEPPTRPISRQRRFVAWSLIVLVAAILAAWTTNPEWMETPDWVGSALVSAAEPIIRILLAGELPPR
jgi:hypothetical protein